MLSGYARDVFDAGTGEGGRNRWFGVTNWLEECNWLVNMFGTNGEIQSLLSELRSVCHGEAEKEIHYSTRLRAAVKRCCYVRSD